MARLQQSPISLYLFSPGITAHGRHTHILGATMEDVCMSKGHEWTGKWGAPNLLSFYGVPSLSRPIISLRDARLSVL